MVQGPDPYEIQGGSDGLTERGTKLFWMAFEDAARDVPEDARKADLKRPGLLLEQLRRYVRDEAGFEDPSIADALDYFCAAARAEGLEAEARAVMIYGKAYLRKLSGGGGSGGTGGAVRARGFGQKGWRGGEER